MSLVVQQASKRLCLLAYLNNTAGQNQTLKLFSNNITPADTDTAGTYTEVTGGGYSSVSLTGSSWSATTATPSVASYAQQTWTFTGTIGGSGIVYGYFLVQATSGTIMWSERDPSPFTPTNNGDQILLTPQITCT